MALGQVKIPKWTHTRQPDRQNTTHGKWRTCSGITHAASCGAPTAFLTAGQRCQQFHLPMSCNFALIFQGQHFPSRSRKLTSTQLPDYPSPAVRVTPNHHHNPQTLWSQQLTVHPAVELPDFAKAKQSPKVRSGVLHWGCIRLHPVCHRGHAISTLWMPMLGTALLFSCLEATNCSLQHPHPQADSGKPGPRNGGEGL